MSKKKYICPIFGPAKKKNRELKMKKWWSHIFIASLKLAVWDDYSISLGTDLFQIINAIIKSVVCGSIPRCLHISSTFCSKLICLC